MDKRDLLDSTFGVVSESIDTLTVVATFLRGTHKAIERLANAKKEGLLKLKSLLEKDGADPLEEIRTAVKQLVDADEKMSAELKRLTIGMEKDIQWLESTCHALGQFVLKLDLIRDHPELLKEVPPYLTPHVFWATLDEVCAKLSQKPQPSGRRPRHKLGITL